MFLALRIAGGAYLVVLGAQDALAVARAGDAPRRGRLRRVLDTLSGCVLVVLGLRLAAERR